MRRLILIVLICAWCWFAFLYFVVGSSTKYLYLDEGVNHLSLSLYETHTDRRPRSKYNQLKSNSPYESDGEITKVDNVLRVKEGWLEFLELSFGPVKSNLFKKQNISTMLLDVTRISMPIAATFYTISGILVVLMAFPVYRSRLRVKRMRRGCCVSCGYLLHGIESAKCPECGALIDAATSGQT